MGFFHHEGTGACVIYSHSEDLAQVPPEKLWLKMFKAKLDRPLSSPDQWQKLFNECCCFAKGKYPGAWSKVFVLVSAMNLPSPGSQPVMQHRARQGSPRALVLLLGRLCSQGVHPIPHCPVSHSCIFCHTNSLHSLKLLHCFRELAAGFALHY